MERRRQARITLVDVRFAMGDQTMGASELLRLFGYSQATYIRDTAFEKWLIQVGTRPGRWKAATP